MSRIARVTATGAVTAFGAGVEPLWRGLRSGATQIARTEAFLAGGAPVARVPDGALPKRRETTWTFDMLTAAMRQLQDASSWARVVELPRERVGVCVGTTQGPIGGWLEDQHRLQMDPLYQPAPPSLADPVHELARVLDARGPVACPSMACASSTAAVGLALDWIRDGRCDAVVAGGVDALSEFVYTGFTNLKAMDPERALPFDENRAGLSLGEGTGLVLLQAGASVSDGPQVAGWGQSADANHITGPDPTGAGVARAMASALHDAGARPEQVDFVNAHGTATVFNDLMESKALSQVFGTKQTPPVNSIKGALGHTMGAAGALEAILCCLVLTHGEIPPTVGLKTLDPEITLDVVAETPRQGDYRCVMSTSSGFGGVNAALVLRT